MLTRYMDGEIQHLFLVYKKSDIGYAEVIVCITTV